LSPAALGHITVPGVWALVARGSYVYAVNHGAGTTGTLTVLNVSNPSSVTVAATRSLGGSTGVDICLSGDGNYAYVSNYGANGQVWNVSNPAAPTLAATLGQTHNGCSVSGSYLYTIDRNGSLFRIYDISNPASPVLKSTVTQTGGADNLTVSGDYAFIPTTNDDKVYVWNVSNKTSPSLVGSTPFVGDPANNYMCRLDVDDRYAYIGGTGLQIFDYVAIGSANTAPVANNDAYSVNEDTVLTIGAPGVLSNDTDAESNP